MMQLIITEILVTSAVPTSLAVQTLENMEAVAANI